MLLPKQHAKLLLHLINVNSVVNGNNNHCNSSNPQHGGGKGKPWVLDPVAVGATEFRTVRAFELMDRSPTVVRGNASEIKVLAGRRG